MEIMRPSFYCPNFLIFSCIVSSLTGWQTFSVKGQRVNILVFVGHWVSVTFTQLCFSNSEAAVDDRQMNGCGRVPVKLTMDPYI